MEELDQGYFTFHHTDVDGSMCEVAFFADTWIEALSRFVQFLRGSGFTLDSDSIGVNADKHCMVYDIGGNDFTIFSNKNVE